MIPSYTVFFVRLELASDSDLRTKCGIVLRINTICFQNKLHAFRTASSGIWNDTGVSYRIRLHHVVDNHLIGCKFTAHLYGFTNIMLRIIIEHIIELRVNHCIAYHRQVYIHIAVSALRRLDFLRRLRRVIRGGRTICFRQPSIGNSSFILSVGVRRDSAGAKGGCDP